MKVLELRGYKSLRVLNAYSSLMLGIKMLPEHMKEPFEEFYDRLERLDDVEKMKTIRKAILFVELQEEELQAILSFASDKNGVPYGPENLKNLNPSELTEIIAAVCFEMSKFKIDLVTEAEKKNLETSPST